MNIYIYIHIYIYIYLLTLLPLLTLLTLLTYINLLNLQYIYIYIIQRYQQSMDLAKEVQYLSTEYANARARTHTH